MNFGSLPPSRREADRIKAERARIPPSPPLFARSTIRTYLTDTTSVMAQKIIPQLVAMARTNEGQFTRLLEEALTRYRR